MTNIGAFSKSAMFTAVGTTVSAGLPVFLIAVLFVQISVGDQVPKWALGVIIASYWTAAAVTSIAAARLTVALGVHRVIIATLALAVISLIGTAALASTWHWFILWSAIGGASSGTCHPAINQLLAVRIPSAYRSLAFGLKQSSVPLATLLSGLAIPGVALTLGWRWGFVFAAVLAAVLMVSLLMFGPRASERRPAPADPHPMGREQTQFFIALAGVTVLGAGGAAIMVSYGVVSAVERGIPLSTAGFLLGGASILGAVARIYVGVLAGTKGRDALRIMAVMQLVGGAGIFVMVPDNPWLYSAGLICAFGMGWGWPGLVHYAVADIAGQATPWATGIVQTGTYVGSAAGPLLAGVLYAVVGDQWIWLLSAGMLTAAGAFGFFVARRPRPIFP